MARIRRVSPGITAEEALEMAMLPWGAWTKAEIERYQQHCGPEQFGRWYTEHVRLRKLIDGGCSVREALSEVTNAV